MTFPAGVRTKTLVVNPGRTQSGDPLSVEVTVSISGPDVIVWTATATPILSYPTRYYGEIDRPVVIELPVTDQPGFVDEAQSPLQLWTYVVSARYSDSKGRRIIDSDRDKVYQPVSAGPAVDVFDTLPSGTPFPVVITPGNLVTLAQQAVADAKTAATAAEDAVTAFNTSKGVPNGLATLNSTGKVPAAQLPEAVLPGLSQEAVDARINTLVPGMLNDAGLSEEQVLALINTSVNNLHVDLDNLEYMADLSQATTPGLWLVNGQTTGWPGTGNEVGILEIADIGQTFVMQTVRTGSGETWERNGSAYYGSWRNWTATTAIGAYYKLSSGNVHDNIDTLGAGTFSLDTDVPGLPVPGVQSVLERWLTQLGVYGRVTTSTGREFTRFSPWGGPGDTGWVEKATKSDLKPVALSGSYTDLTDKPTIPTVPNNIMLREDWGGLDLHGNSIIGLNTPTTGDHAANKSYVDSRPTGLDQNSVDARIETAASNFRLPRVREFPGTSAIPSLNTSLGTQVLSAANAASTITSAVKVMPNFENYRVIGTDPQWGTVYPDYTGWKNTLWTKTSNGPWAVEFEWDTTIGVLEIIIKGNGIPVTAMLNGQYVSATPAKPPADGSTYNVVVTAAAGAGRYRVRLEFDGNLAFYGVNIGPTDSITATPKRPIRAVWVGDSFAEPTISDTNTAGTWQGVSMGSTFGWITGWEIVHAGLGGTGMVNPGTGGRVKYADRMDEILALKNLDIVIYQMSGNDSAQTTSSVLTQVQALIDKAKAAGFTKYGQIIFVSSWWTQYSQSIPALMIDQNMQAKVLCQSQNVIYVDTLMPDVPNAVTTTITNSPGSNTTNINTAVQIPAPPPLGSSYSSGQEVYVVIGNPGAANLEIKKVSTSNATSVSVTPNLRSAHTAGERIMQIGSSPLTGTGRQGATTGSGNADRYTGPDTTHPTIAGHRWRGIAYAARLSTILPH